VTEALWAVQSDIDLLGWFEPRDTIGLIVPEVDPGNLTGTCDRLERTFRSAIKLQGDGELVQRLSIRLLVFPEPTASDEKQVSPMESLFYPELLGNVPVATNFQTLKRGIDIVLSALLLILLLPAFAFIAVLVKLSSPGPVFFKQTRVGHLLKPFTMYKFRSMCAKADHQVHHDYVSWFIAASDQAQFQQKPDFFKLTNDTRITPVGRILRRTSLDELPQIWNVLIGDMSLVGPRPPLPYELQQYKPWHRRRLLEAMPGITGLWQVVGRSRTTFDEMVRLDLRYARTQSLWSDIKILLATPAAMITGKGAC
jgi:lipopolysaccharide/colanic/teichoic acid biosynthesis glycosyltransferase